MRSTKPMMKKDSFSERRPGGGATAGAVSAHRHILYAYEKKKCAQLPHHRGRAGGQRRVRRNAHQTTMILLLHLFHKNRKQKEKQTIKQMKCCHFFSPETHKQIIDNTKQPQQPRQETQTTVPPDPPRFRTLSPKRQSATATTHTRAHSTTSQKIVQCFLQKKNELKIHGGR